MNRSVSPSKALSVILVVAAALAASTAFAWGITGHQIITDKAISRLSGEIAAFFRANEASLYAFSNGPDLVSARDAEEGPNHYFDVDMFDPATLVSLPESHDEFLKGRGADASRAGRLPWAVQARYDALVKALEARDYEAILKEAGYLSHYVADSTMPLHATLNYKGQHSGNVIYPGDGPERHVHVRFEIGMIDAYAAEISGRIENSERELRPVRSPVAETLVNLYSSLALVDGLLAADRALLKPGDELEPGYYEGLYKACGEMAVDTMALAALEVASFWQSAYEEAGRPRLTAAEVVLTRGTVEAAE